MCDLIYCIGKEVKIILMMKGAKIPSYFIHFLYFNEISACTIEKLFGWKSKIFSEESIITLVNPSNGLTLRLNPINNAKI